MSEHIKKSHNVSFLLYHLVCPAKYRKVVFDKTDDVNKTIVQTCEEISKRYDIHFIEIGTDKNHIHFLIQSVPMISPSKIARIVKSITAREIFKQVPEIKKSLWGGEFWTKGYYVNTVGKSANEEAIKDYIKNQGTKDRYEQLHLNQPTLFEGYY